MKRYLWQQFVRKSSIKFTMGYFDDAAPTWDKNQMHLERSEAIAQKIREKLPLNKNMKALEFGAGTGLLSFSLRPSLGKITLLDNSPEMTRVSQEKITAKKIDTMQAICVDLTSDTDFDEKFSLIYTQMVLHHVQDVPAIIQRFYQLLHPGGYIALADLYTEDGSFHGDGFDGHRGFDMDELSKICTDSGFHNISHAPCYAIEREGMLGEEQKFPLFLFTAIK